jgi:hypothetical protein
MSWGAFGLGVTQAGVQAASDFIHTNLQSSGFRYVNIDAGLSSIPPALVQSIHANGQKVGVYRVPFSYFYSASDPDPLGKPAGSTGYTYRDVVLTDDSGNPIKHNGGYVLDVTHPGTKAMIQGQMQPIGALGIDFVKLDFMTAGAMEGRHFDTSVKTGIQAYNQAMSAITALVGPNVFVSLSIAPLFPSQYAHARRVSCDVLGQLNDLGAPTYPHYGSTEYLMNAETFAWWASGTIYPFNDPDAMELLVYEGQHNLYPLEWARTRVTASAIGGTVFLDTTDVTSAAGASRVQALLTNASVDAIAAKGRAFRPLDGDVGRVTAPITGFTAVNSGSAAANVFVLVDGGKTYLALFNFDDANAASRHVDLARAGLDATRTYAVTDLWAQASAGTATGALDVTLQPGQSRLLELAPP